jgi:hypothetical protein
LVLALYLPLNSTSFIEPMDQSLLVEIKRLHQKTKLIKLFGYKKEQSTTARDFLKAFLPKDRCPFKADALNIVIITTLSRAWNRIFEKTDPVGTTEGPDCPKNDFLDISNASITKKEINDKDFQK